MKKSLICFIVIILFLYDFPILGQIIRCGTPSPTQLIATNALYKITGNLSIPVVFHVVYSGADNVTDAQLSSQITALNNAYSPYQISFYLSGTTRTNNSAWQNITRGSQQETDMTNSLSIDPQYKLNIYITAINPLGYAINWPWDVSEYSKQNGVVIKPGTLPSGNLQDYNEGKTAVHEVGHYLGLYHTFENQCTSPGDMVDDTPYHQENNGCPSENTNTCPQTGNDPIHNFMNYTSDPCMNQFTNGQMQRGRGIVSLYKPRLGNQYAPAKIDHFYQQPDPLYNGGTGYVYAVIAPGIDNVTYSWLAYSDPPNITLNITPDGSRCQVHYYIPYNTNPNITLVCTARNAYGSDTQGYTLKTQLYGYSSSASLAFETNGILTDENPILVSSSDNPGVYVTDYYLINEEIKPENNAVKFLIHETDQTKGHTYLDQVEFWEVKANKNEFIAVTEESEAISYKKLEIPNQIFLNDSLDITNILADKDNLKLTVKKGDRIKISRPGNTFSNNEELYSIFYAQLDYKDVTESSLENNNFGTANEYNFRPKPSATCKKIQFVPSGGIEIKFTEDLIIDYYAIVKNEKTAKVEKLKLLEAIHKAKGDVSKLLTEVDGDYNEIYPGEKVSFIFESNNNSDEKVAYILKTVGRYEESNPKMNKKASETEIANNEINSIKTKLLRNYPNPFNPSTNISYKLKENTFIELTIINSLGQEVKKLVSKYQVAGYYSIPFDGSKLSSGVYFVLENHVLWAW